MPVTLPKSILYSYFSKILTRGSEELHFSIAFCSASTFAEHHSTIVSEAKYETAIHNSLKCFFHMKKRKNAFLPMKKYKMNIYKMNPFSVHYHYEIEQN